MKQRIISLIHPSRQRSDMALDTLIKWVNNAANINNIEYILSIDSDDPNYNDYEGLLLFAASKFRKVRLSVFNNLNVVDAANAGAKLAKGDVFVLMSDDFDCPLNWDEFILNNIDYKKQEALQVNDGFQPEVNDILTIPIITKKLYKKLGYIYYPKYIGWGADNDLAELCVELGCLRKNYTKPFVHNHWRNNKRIKDNTDNRHDSVTGIHQGTRLLQERRKSKFMV